MCEAPEKPGAIFTKGEIPMKTFMGKNFLLSNDVAKALYHNVAAKLPIIEVTSCNSPASRIFAAHSAHRE